MDGWKENAFEQCQMGRNTSCYVLKRRNLLFSDANAHSHCNTGQPMLTDRYFYICTAMGSVDPCVTALRQSRAQLALE